MGCLRKRKRRRKGKWKESSGKKEGVSVWIIEGLLLKYQVINADTKGVDRSAIKKRIKLMK